MPYRLVGLPTLVAGAIVTLLATWPASAVEKSRPQIDAPLYERFAPKTDDKPATDEVPDFQKHVSPLLGRLGCNGRACHGSFQGQGGFQLSLFGYDFDADYKALLEDGAARVDLDDKLESLILTKPVDADLHDGGMRYEHGGWEYWVLRRWIESGAKYRPGDVQKLERLEVTPQELNFSDKGQRQQLQVIAHWEDGRREDVTCLCRFQSNDSAIAGIDAKGLVTSGEPGDTHVVVSYDNAVVPIAALHPLSDQTGDKYPQVATTTEIDRLVVQKLKKLGVVPSEICSDEEFLRRASLDVTGTLPSSEEITAFLADTGDDKRAKKIDELLSRPAYAAQWTTFLCDITGNNEDQLNNVMPRGVSPANQWYHWIYQRIDDNVPYDELVEGLVTAVSRADGEDYQEYCANMSEVCQDRTGKAYASRPGLVHYWSRRNFQSAEDRAIGFAYAFLGVRIQCAQCHKHPFDQWSKSDFDNFERLFSGVQARQNTLSSDAKKEFAKMVSDLGIDKSLKGNRLRQKLGDILKEGKVVPMPELVVNQPRAPRNNKSKDKNAKPQVPQAKLLGGEWVALGDPDVRNKLMQWMRSPDNPYFAKALVNRVWAQYFGLGIVNPPDDLSLANAPSNAPLLDMLASGFVENGFDLKWLHREILSSDTYQRSWIPNETNALDRRNFSHSLLRRLPAEATYDAVRMALVNDGLRRQAHDLEVPRATTRAGSSARNNTRDDQSYALSVFGRSVRESNCDCDRSSEPSLLQTVFLVNDSAVQQWLSDPKVSWVSSVADKYDWQKPGLPEMSKERKKQLQEMLDRLATQKEAMDERIATARDKGQTKLLKSLQQRRAEMIKRVRSVAKKNGVTKQLEQMLAGETPSDDSPTSTSQDRMSEEQALWVAENAYLRSLSRRPNTDELAVAMRFLRSEDEPTTAVEGLLWSLINTKEFILNH